MPIIDLETVKERVQTLEPLSAAYKEACAAAGTESERAVGAEYELADALLSLQEYEKSLSHWEHIVEYYAENYGEDDELTLEAAEYMALCLCRLGRKADAQEVCDYFGLDEDILTGR